MKETIYTIPINEAFEQRDGCPLCRLDRRLESETLDYIMGAAMMEPDVRIGINHQGFCRDHYDRMLGMNRRLSLALTLESRLGELRKYIEKDAKKAFGGSIDTAKAGKLLGEASGDCFVCRRIADTEEKYYKNLLFMWKTEEGFRKLFVEQPYFCLRHTVALSERAVDNLGKKLAPDFQRALLDIFDSALTALNGDVSAFCKSFDYRSAGEALTEEQKTAAERAVELLAGF